LVKEEVREQKNNKSEGSLGGSATVKRMFYAEKRRGQGKGRHASATKKGAA